MGLIDWTTIIVLAIVTVSLLFSLFFVTKAASDIGIKTQDSRLKEAHKYLTWTSVLSWIMIAVLVVMVIIFVVFGEELVLFIGGWVINGLLFIVIVMVLGIGVMSAIASDNIRKSQTYKDGNAGSSFTDATMGAVIALSTVGILFLLVGFEYIRKKKKERLHATAVKNIKKIETKMTLDRLVGNKPE